MAAPAAELVYTVEYLSVQSSCPWVPKAALFCSSKNLIPPSLVLEYNLCPRLHFELCLLIGCFLCFLILSFNSFTLTDSKHAGA